MGEGQGVGSFSKRINPSILPPDHDQG
jgi:hypothetical protein